MFSALPTSLAIALLVLPALVHAEDYPEKSIRFIIPYPPGGITDVVGRLVGQKMSQEFGQPVVIDNRPGAGGNIAARLAATSKPDGYTLFMGFPGSHAANVHLYKELGYDPIKDFQPVGLLVKSPMILFVHPAAPARSVAELIAYTKVNPGKLNFGSSGNGGASHLALVMLNMIAAIDITHVPYKGTSSLEADIAAGRIAGHFASQTSSMASVKAGLARAVAVTSLKRIRGYPDLPTFAETLPGFEYWTWLGILTPARVLSERIEKLNRTIRKVLAAPEMRVRFEDNGLEAVGGTPQEFADFIAAETRKFGQIVKASGVRIE